MSDTVFQKAMVGLAENPITPLVIVGGALLVYAWARIPTGALNPASRENVIYRGVNQVGGAITGQGEEGFSLGSWIYDITHPYEEAGGPSVTYPSARADEDAWTDNLKDWIGWGG